MTAYTPPRFTTRPEIDGTFGVVASTHWTATAVGMGVLERGGNAFDAAVATAFTLQVVEPHLNGPGGEAPFIIHSVRDGKTHVVCGQGPAPLAATLEHFANLGLDLIPGNGLLAACVPGAFDACMLLLRDYGTLGPEDVLEPAIAYAEGGYPVLDAISLGIAAVAPLFREHWPTSAAVYLPGDEVPARGSTFANTALAATYRRILDEAGADRSREQRIDRARAAWSRGFVAEAIDRFCRTESVMDVTGEAHGGLLTGYDLARWEATFEAPLAYTYGDLTVMKADTWTQGLAALQQLALLSGFSLDGLDPTGPDFIHLQVEAAKLALADRDAFYGDPAFVEVPVETLLSPAYNGQRRGLITSDASHEARPGKVPGFGMPIETVLARAAGAIAAATGSGDPLAGARRLVAGDTVHLDVIDRDGNMVSATPSGGWLQSSPVIPELGFCLGTRAQMFVLDDDHPAGLAPGKRPRSTLTPTLALRDGEPYLAWGTPGGDQQDQWIVQFLLRHMHAGYNLQEAIDAPAWHTDHAPASFWPRLARPGVLVIEDRVPAATIEELRRRGHIIEMAPAWSEGRLTAAARAGKQRKAAANARGMQGYAAGR